MLLMHCPRFSANTLNDTQLTCRIKEEPSVEWLAMVDDDAPDVEQEVPDASTSNDEELAATVERMVERRLLLSFCQAVSNMTYHCCLVRKLTLQTAN